MKKFRNTELKENIKQYATIFHGLILAFTLFTLTIKNECEWGLTLIGFFKTVFFDYKLKQPQSNPINWIGVDI